MKSTAPLRASIWPRQYPALPDVASAFILAVAFAFRRAIMAARRYEQLRLKARAYHDPAAYPARQVYREFYYNGRE